MRSRHHRYDALANRKRPLLAPLQFKPGLACFFLNCMFFCPWAVAEKAIRFTSEPVGTLKNGYFDSSLIVEIALAMTLVMVSLGYYLIHTKAKLDHSLDHARQITRQLKLSTEQLSHIVATSPTILFSMKVDKGRLVPLWISENLTRIVGYSIDEALNPDWWEQHLHVDDRARVLSESKDLFLGQHLTYEYRFMHKNGSVLWIRDEQQLVCDKNGLPLEVMAAWTDITERKLEEIDLRITATAFNTKEGIIITDSKGHIIRVNNAFTGLTGYSMEEVIGKTPKIFQSGRHGKDFYQQMWRDIKEKQYWEGEVWDRHKSGNIYAIWLAVTAITDHNGNVTHYVSTFFDISERKKAEEYVQSLAFYDPLTQLPNRRLLMDRLGLALISSHRSCQHGALMFMDMDRFKILNDTQGHDTGDQLLVEVAKRLQSCVREGDTVARIGGDEFVVMLENLSKIQEEAVVQTQAVAEKIREVLAETYWLKGRSKENAALLEHHASASIGLVLFSGHTVSSEDLLKRADMAMYQAKQAGCDTIRIFDPIMQSALNERMALEADLRQALARNELTLHYQVQVNACGQPVGAEVLLYWHQAQRGSVLPAKFILLAEETGLIIPIGNWVLAQSCVTLAKWAEDPVMHHLTLSVNISGRQFRQPEFVKILQSVLEATRADPKRLKLEITESLAMQNLDATINKMMEITQLGVGFAMDNFGTGYASLSNLPRLPLEMLKIDKGFVLNLLDENENTLFIRNILSVGRNLKLTVIAAGVETEAQWKTLANCGCVVFQGHFFGKPMSLLEFEARLLEKQCV